MNIDMRQFINHRVLEVPEYDQKHITTCWQREGQLLRLMSNESSYKPIEEVQTAIKQIASKVNWYAEDVSYAKSLRKKLADYTNVKPENITLGNGSMELLDLMFMTFCTNPGIDQIIIPAPDYSAYPIRAGVFGMSVKEVLLGEAIDTFVDSVDSVIELDTKIILLSRPNNPTGLVMKEDHIFKLLEKDVLVIVDEAYVELSDPGTSIAQHVNDWDNLLVLRTFSKGFGLAGLRIGYLIANSEIIRYINMARHIFNVNLVAMTAAEAVLDNLDEAQRAIEEQKETRNWLIDEIEKIPGLRPIPSQANFVFIDVSESGRNASDFVNFLSEHNFFVRDFSKKVGLKKNHYFRITVGYPEDIQRLVDVLKTSLHKI